MADSPQASSDKPHFQFRLRTLLAGVAIIGGLLAVMVRVDAAWSMALVWSLLLVAAHVIGNTWNSWSRDHGAGAPGDDAAASLRMARPIEFAPATRLRRTTGLPVVMLVFAGAGAVIGSIAGSTILAVAYVGRIGYLGIGIGAFSGATLGGCGGFLVSSFVGIAGRAWREASRDARDAPAPPTAERPAC